MTKEGRLNAYNQLQSHGIDAVVLIGGNGTFTGATVFQKEFPDIKFIGLPGTIDNDLFGTDFTIGFDTAVNTAVEAVDRIRDTADSHGRLFFVEVMGRDSGFIALHTALASGASMVMLPETSVNIKDLVLTLERERLRKKLFNIVIVAEGNQNGGAIKLAEQVKKESKQFEIKVTILGHIQRGGTPTASDRILATRLGNAAVEALVKDQVDVMLGVVNDKILATKLIDAIQADKKPMGDRLLSMASRLAL